MKRVSPVYSAQVDHYLAEQRAFAHERRQAADEEPRWLAQLRAEAAERFAEIGFPSPALEEWKYTNVAAIAKLPLRFESGAEIGGASPWIASLIASLREDPDAMRERLARCPEPKDRAFALLNTAFLAQGAVVLVPRETSLEDPLWLTVPAPGAGRVQQPRVLIDLDRGARATVVIDHPPGHARAGSLTNLLVDVEIGVNASLDLVLVQQQDDARFHVSKTSARVARGGSFSSHTLTAGGALVRNDLDVVLAGEGADCNLRGLFLGSGKGVVDNHSFVDHAVPHCRSAELYKGILGGRARGVFRGRVIVRPDAQRSDATQSNPNLLLSDGAEIDTKPQLEIYADDVKCAHGATVGQLDDEALFYLRSRGIGLADARALMIRAFASEILETLPDPGVAPLVAVSLQSVLEAETR